jgi:hypothetical protein
MTNCIFWLFFSSNGGNAIGPQVGAKSEPQPMTMTGASISREPQPASSNFQSSPMPPQGYSQYPPMPNQPVPSPGLFANQIPGYGMPPAPPMMNSPVPPPPASGAYSGVEGGNTRKAEEESTEAPGTKKARYEGPPMSEDAWLAHHPVSQFSSAHIFDGTTPTSKGKTRYQRVY